MVQSKNQVSEQLPYDRSRTGYELDWVTEEFVQEDGSVVRVSGAREPRERAEENRVRCGPYTVKNADGSVLDAWGDHRLTRKGTTCEDVDCRVPHHPDIAPGWSEPQADYYDRPGVHAAAAALEGWDGGGLLPRSVGTTLAWVGAHVVLDALRDAGYEVTKKD